MAATEHYGYFAPERQAGAQHVLADYGYHRAELLVAAFDRVELPTGVEVNSKIHIGDVSWDFIPIRELSYVNFDDAGTGVVLDFGDENDPDALIDGQDIAAAAGSASLLKTVDISKEGDPLWKLLGYADREAAVTARGAVARPFFTVLGATTGNACSLAWKLVGTRA